MVISADLTAIGDQSGWACSSRAASPATYPAATDVPDDSAYRAGVAPASGRGPMR